MKRNITYANSIIDTREVRSTQTQQRMNKVYPMLSDDQSKGINKKSNTLSQ